MNSSEPSARSSRSAVGRGDGGVAGHRQQRSDLTLAGRLDLLGEADDGKLTEELGQPAHPRAPAPEAHAAPDARFAARVGAARGGLGEHRAARSVEVAREHVEDVDEPRRERAELLRARADARVHRGRRRTGEVACDAARRLRFDSGVLRDSLGRELFRDFTQVVEPVHVVGERTEIDQILGEQDVGQREEEQRVGSGPDRDVFVGFLGGLRPARIDDDETTTTRSERAQARGKVGRREQTAVGRERVRAEHEEIVGAVDIRDRDRQRAAEHEAGRDLLRHLVDGARAVDVAAPQRLQQHPVVEDGTEVVRVRIAEVRRHRVVPVRGADLAETPLDLRERFAPADLPPRLALADHRDTYAVGVGLELLDRRALRAEVTRD